MWSSGVAEITGEDIDTDKVISDFEDMLDEIESIEDIATFGEFQATEFISRNEESISNGYVTEYYSSASFDEVVTHFKTMLEGTED